MKPVASQAKYKKVLLIDDDGIDNFINERIITSTRFSEQAIVKNTVKGAITYIDQVITEGGQLPEIIFLDLNMPNVDGFGFLDEFEKICTSHASMSKSCKIIVLSSSVSPDDINRVSLNPYVYKYINKPLSEKYLSAINF
jgi:CheY-like chemotaxis protein